VKIICYQEWSLLKLVIVPHAYNLGTQEAEAR
jgi:hypothetical protein